MSGKLPSWFYLLWLSLQTVAPFKTSEKTTVRPLGMRNTLVKVFHKEVMVQNKMEIREFLEPVQVGLSVSGAALLTRCKAGVLNTHRDFVCFRIDLQNAFNEMSRRAVLDVLANEPNLSHLVSFAALILSPEPALETGGRKWGETAEGLVQGDTPSGDLFAIGLQPDLLELDMACRQGEDRPLLDMMMSFLWGPLMLSSLLLKVLPGLFVIAVTSSCSGTSPVFLPGMVSCQLGHQRGLNWQVM